MRASLSFAVCVLHMEGTYCLANNNCGHRKLCSTGIWEYCPHIIWGLGISSRATEVPTVTSAFLFYGQKTNRCRHHQHGCEEGRWRRHRREGPLGITHLGLSFPSLPVEGPHRVQGRNLFIESLRADRTQEREYRSLERIQDNYPKYILSLDCLLQRRSGILHKNIVDLMSKNGGLTGLN